MILNVSFKITFEMDMTDLKMLSVLWRRVNSTPILEGSFLSYKNEIASQYSFKKINKPSFSK